MPTRRGKEPEKKEFIPACGFCDDGWLHYAYRVTDWFDGKTHKERIYGPEGSPMDRGKLPGDSDEKDRKIRHYTAVRRCGCMGERSEDKEPPIEMPKHIRGGMRKLGAFVDD